jgi:glycosyltransferase involved in cell wall biosynthesis
LLAPSLWRFEEVEEKFSGRCMVKYLPPPTDSQIFKRNKEVNSIRTNKLLHIGGKAAIYDRNGTNSVIDMLKHSNSDYELVIKSQTILNIESEDKRITALVGNEINREDMYSGYDAMILPRKYAGLCLPMNEALMSGLPVFMTDISPNNIILHGRWLSDASFVKDFMARIGIKLYEADPKSLAKVVDKYFSQNNLSNDKQEAFDIGYNNFSSEKLKESYLDLINSL